MKEIKILKDSLRIINSKYVSSKKLDDNSYQIIFTYKNRNYNLDINKQYKFMMLSIRESVYGMGINNDTLELIDYIRQMIMFTSFENFNVFAVSIRKEMYNEEIHKVLQITQERDDSDIIIDVETITDKGSGYDSTIIEYTCGLNNFDKRLFDDDIFEDFNEKVGTLKEEDLFLMSTTLISYFYKLTNNVWDGERIDLYIINDILTILYEEIQSRLKEQTYYEWFDEWDNYFSEENKEQYLNIRNKEKNKKLN